MWQKTSLAEQGSSPGAQEGKETMISGSKVGPHRKVSNLCLVYTGRRHKSSELELVEIFMSGNKKGVLMYVASKRRSTVNIGLVLFEGGHLTKRIKKTAEIFNTFFASVSNN